MSNLVMQVYCSSFCNRSFVIKGQAQTIFKRLYVTSRAQLATGPSGSGRSIHISTMRPSVDGDVEAQGTQAQRDSVDGAAAGSIRSYSQVAFRPQDVSSATPMSPKSKLTHRTGTHSSLHSLRKRKTNLNNVSYGAIEMGRATGWAPGQEPGIDTSDPAPPYTFSGAAGGDTVRPEKLSQRCQISCVDYSEDNMSMFNLDNDTIGEFLAKPKPEWSQVRWINVNGLSWDVIRCIGNHKGLHRLAIEDLMNTRSRTKADWYNDHTFIVLPLQKLVNTEMESDMESGSEDAISDKEDDDSVSDSPEHEVRDFRTRYIHESDRAINEQKHKQKRSGAIMNLVRDIILSRRRKQRKAAKMQKDLKRDTGKLSNEVVRSTGSQRPWRTLQQWHAGPNQDRTHFMERYSSLSRKGLAVSMEQVSIFLCADGTVISFFEYSAPDVEMPIIRRLQTSGTILRTSCDASMLLESILDAIVDLAIPVTTAYQDTLGDLELEVLTDPDIIESKQIYILTSELSVLRNAIAPVAQLMGALKDHKSSGPAGLDTDAPASQSTAEGAVQPARPGALQHKSFYNTPKVTVSPLTVMYLGDAEDHAILIQDSYDQMRRSADNLVDLIFNTVSAYQNESMKQLSLVTCFFLPLSFISGYMGMNFARFPSVQDHSEAYFWYIAAPVSVAVLLLLLRESLSRYFAKAANKALISRVRKRRLQARQTPIK